MSAVSSLKRGATVLILRESDQLVGKILTVSLSQLGIQVPQAPESEFEVNEKITLQYWGEDDALYNWETKVDQVTGYGAQILLSILNGSTQRRKYHRFNFPLQVMATIVDTSEKGLKGKQVLLETQDVSAGGLLLETTLRLSVGDKMKLDIKVNPNEEIHAYGWIVRSKPVTKVLHETGTVRKAFHSLAVEFLQLEREDQLRLLKFFLQARSGSNQ